MLHADAQGVMLPHMLPLTPTAMVHRLIPHLARLRSRFARTVSVLGEPIYVAPGILDPVATKAGAWFAEQVADLHVGGMTILDLGCGTGVVGMLAKRAGAQVIAVDLDPAAVACAQRNGLTDVREGDLFAPVSGMGFDRICFNPPFIPAEPQGRLLDLAMMGGQDLGTIRRFNADVLQHLNEGGLAWVVLSARYPTAAEVLGPDWHRLRAGSVGGETFVLWQRGL